MPKNQKGRGWEALEMTTTERIVERPGEVVIAALDFGSETAAKYFEGNPYRPLDEKAAEMIVRLTADAIMYALHRLTEPGDDRAEAMLRQTVDIRNLRRQYDVAGGSQETPDAQPR
ncbi:MAG: hypothetical protein KGR26_11805 [Cyanobacteria bacterium REEB65]|nr:hypothetical protein [Cyanobacteria bacterium REEB65]